MNFKHFDRLLMESSYDEIRVIGKDIELDGHCAHMIGMTRKDKQARINALELAEHSDEEATFQSITDKNHRQQ